MLFLASLPADAQTNRTLATHFQSGSSRFGSKVVALGDVNGNGIPDFAVSAPDGAGQVQVFDGSTPSGGTALWSLSGAGVEGLGTALATVPDMSGDGIDDLAVSSPSLTVTLNAQGRIRFLDAGNGAQLATFDGPVASAEVGHVMTRIHDATGDGLDDLLVFKHLSTGNRAVVVDGGTGGAATEFPIFSNTSNENVFSGAGDFDQDGNADEVAIANPVTGELKIVTIVAGVVTEKNINGPTGEQFGWSLAFVNDPTTGVAALIVGAPSGGTSGRIYEATTGGVIQVLASGTGLGGFGDSLATGSDIDGDGKQDILVGHPRRGRAFVVDQSGTILQEIIGSGTGGQGAVAFIGDVLGGFPDVALGCASVAGGLGGRVDVLSGGPAATLNNQFRPSTGCPGPTGVTLSLSGPLVPGVQRSLDLGGAVPTSFGILFVGFPDPVGSNVNGCTAFLQLSPIGPQVIIAASTDPNLGTLSAPFTVPPGVANLGIELGFQGLVDFNGLMAFSNAVTSAIGW